MWTDFPFCLVIVILMHLRCVDNALVHKHGDRGATEILNILEQIDFMEKGWHKNMKERNDVHTTVDELESEVRNWLRRNDVELATRANGVITAEWNYLVNLTDANAERLSQLDVVETKWVGDRIVEAKRYLGQSDRISDPDVIRQLKSWCYRESEPVAKNEDTINAISRLKTQLEELYGKAKVTKDGKIYRIEPEFNELMQTSRDYELLKWAWQAWRDATGPKAKKPFTDLVRELNIAARDNGFDDIGVSWRVFCYETDDIIPMVDSLFDDILPLYKQLHAYVRHRLVEYYGNEKLDPNGPIPAHILGNMWAQEWVGIYDIVTPFPEVSPFDVTSEMRAQNYTPVRMFRLAESFFTSLGLEPMTAKFWNYSMIVRPPDRQVECHASAEDFLLDDDFRIKMCTTVDEANLGTIHHEMGHIEYFMQYRHQPTVYRDGANAAFHEAIGDTIALSVMTPEHMTKIGLLPHEQAQSTTDVSDSDDCFTKAVSCSDKQKRTLNGLMKTALEKIAFLPFGYLLDKWRWDVFSGKATESDYNSKWWQYREKYQGVTPPVQRTENDFDPGCKYHVDAFNPYIRYFLSFIGQFQFHEALCKVKGHTGSLHTCDIYQSTEAGDLLKSVLSAGSSKPWRDVMEEFTGQRQFSTRSLYEYFSPLYKWLLAHNQRNNVKIGWTD